MNVHIAKPIPSDQLRHSSAEIVGGKAYALTHKPNPAVKSVLRNPQPAPFPSPLPPESPGPVPAPGAATQSDAAPRSCSKAAPNFTGFS